MAQQQNDDNVMRRYLLLPCDLSYPPFPCPIVAEQARAFSRGRGLETSPPVVPLRRRVLAHFHACDRLSAYDLEGMLI